MAAAGLLLALVCRVLWVLQTDGHTPTGDAADYDHHARWIAAGDGYPPSLVGGPAAHRPPAYPYFLAGLYKLTGDSALSARYAQAFLGAVAVGLIGLLAWRIWGARVGLIALVLAAVFPPLIISSTTLISEALVVPLVVASIVTACEARRSRHALVWLSASGALAGLVALTRPNGFLLLVPVAIAAWTTQAGGGGGG
ncbi:MAG: hypothetical protein QOJ97_1063, partial [Solirubrobacteraceae bacterium]|nr:hypothetical protein [Solirubrobacteraceae bacterium]